jgi:Cu/Zn superoxide dismutase
MKKLFTVICCLTIALAANAQTTVTKVNKKNKISITKSTTPEAATNATNVTPSESLTLKEKEFDFGKIPQGKPVTHIFEFTNTSDKPFALGNVVASCGCTTPEWSKDTVAAGATAFIKVGYNAANEGPFTKQVNIFYNENQTKQIIIKGEVWKTPETSAPVNSTLNSLKNEQ